MCSWLARELAQVVGRAEEAVLRKSRGSGARGRTQVGQNKVYMCR